MAAPGDNNDFVWPVLTLDRTGLYSKIFDNGMQKLHNSGQLKIWYEEDPNASSKNIDPLLKVQ